MKQTFIFFILCGTLFPGYSQLNTKSSDTNDLIVPILLKKEQRFHGNPFATYAAMVESESRYLSTPFKDIYLEQKYNMEEFLGFPMAGKTAMNKIQSLKLNYGNKDEEMDKQYFPLNALSVIKEEAKTHRIIIWGEEHHLQQTRILYKELIQELWKLGYRYLAAESFTKEVEDSNFKIVNYEAGFYTMDPIYGDAIRTALQTGFKLISYDNNESERDRQQAENIKTKVFDKDLGAKVLILAGRGHIVESKTADGWEPMGYWLKRLTGIDPLQSTHRP